MCCDCDLLEFDSKSQTCLLRVGSERGRLLSRPRTIDPVADCVRWKAMQTHRALETTTPNSCRSDGGRVYNSNLARENSLSFFLHTGQFSAGD